MAGDQVEEHQRCPTGTMIATFPVAQRGQREPEQVGEVALREPHATPYQGDCGARHRHMRHLHHSAPASPTRLFRWKGIRGRGVQTEVFKFGIQRIRQRIPWIRPVLRYEHLGLKIIPGSCKASQRISRSD